MIQPTWAAGSPRRPLGAGAGKLGSVGVASYRTDHELTFYLRALQKIRCGRLVVVLGLRGGRGVPADLPTGVRIILTVEANDLDPEEVVGWFVPDPLRAVAVAMDSLGAEEGLIVLFPADWRGESPDSLVEKARCRQAARPRG